MTSPPADGRPAAWPGPAAAGSGRPRTVADDPAWRRQLAARAAIAVALGAVAGLVGGRLARRR